MAVALYRADASPSTYMVSDPADSFAHASSKSFGSFRKGWSMALVSLLVPDDLVKKLALAGTNIAGALGLAAAFSLCSRGVLSTSQAARLAGLTYADFLEAAARDKIELFPVDFEELKEEITCGYTLGRCD